MATVDKMIHDGEHDNLGRFKKGCGGYHRSEETKRKIGLANTGKKRSEESKRKMSESSKGCKAWNKGLTKETDERVRKASESLIGIKPSCEARAKMRKAKLGKRLSLEHIKHMSDAHRGLPHFQDPEYRRKISERMSGKNHPQYGKTGSLSHNWKGGLTPLMKLIRQSSRYKQWRTDVFVRDDFTCSECNERDCWVEAHHCHESFSSIFYRNEIKNMQQALDCQEFWDIDNGKTLCKECHYKIPKKAVGRQVEHFNGKS